MKHVLHGVCAICSMFTSIRLLNKILIVWAAKWTKFGRTGIVTKAFDCHERRHKGSLEGVRSGPGFVCWSCTASKPVWERFCIGTMLQCPSVLLSDPSGTDLSLVFSPSSSSSSSSSRPVSDYYYKCLIYHIQASGSPQPIHFLKAHDVS